MVNFLVHNQLSQHRQDIFDQLTATSSNTCSLLRCFVHKINNKMYVWSLV